MIMDPGILVPPKGYGGHERLVAMFAEEYLQLGHEVYLFVTPGSFIEGCIMHPFGKEGFPPKKKDAFKTILEAWRFLIKHWNEFDLVHNFGRLAYLLPILPHRVKKIMTYGREIDRKNTRIFTKLPHRNIIFTGCSNDLLSRAEIDNNWEVVYNAINFKKYTIRSKIPENAPLIFLGRIERVKGCHHAIEIARATGNTLIIAGNTSPLAKEQEYFKNEIEPFIDGVQIQYVGEVNDEQKNFYLGKSKALLFPIKWNEPFGMVMIEAMACGTPVIGFNTGSVPEVIDEGITGFVVSSEEGMAACINRLAEIDRHQCREQAALRFDVKVIAKQYLHLFSATNRIVITTSGQPSANPRVVKEAMALDKAGYKVTVIYAPLSPWADEFDKKLFAKTNGIQWVKVGMSQTKYPLRYSLLRARRKIYELGFKYFKKIGNRFENAFVIYATELKRMTVSRKAELYIAHNLGALPSAVRAAKKWDAFVGFDAEDYHRGETPADSLSQWLTTKIEDKYIPSVDYFTAASPLIALAYTRLFPGKNVMPVNNVFSVEFLQSPSPNIPGALTLFWFSQFVDIDRGLENVVAALNQLKDCNITLHLMGNSTEEYKSKLLQFSENPEAIYFIEPVSPDEIFKVASKYDIGLATEIPHTQNREICLTNKLFSYLLAGNCIVASDTAAQKIFFEENVGIGLLYKNGDVVDIARQIRMLYENPGMVNNCKLKSLELARTKFNWEIESQKFLKVIEKTLKNNTMTPITTQVQISAHL